MIVLDPQDQQGKLETHVAGPTLRPPDRVTVAGRSSSLLLPDYETSQALHSDPIRTLPSSPTSPTISKPRKHSARFWRATLYALVIYILISVAIVVPIVVTKTRKAPDFAPLPWDINKSQSSSLSITQSGVLSIDGDAALCDRYRSVDEQDAEDSLWYSLASHSFDPKGSFLIRSNATVDSVTIDGFDGNLTVDINTDATEDDVIIRVSVITSDPRIRAYSHVCFLDDGPSRGLSLYIPDDLDTDDYLSFSVSVLFPKSSSRNAFDCFKTDLDMFSQTFGSLSDVVSFSLMDFQGSYGDIACGSLESHAINVKSSIGAIYGTFNVSEALGLDTVQGPILANITLVHDPARDAPTILHLDTGNSPLRTNITLYSPSAPSSNQGPPKYVAQIKTFNAPLVVNFTYDPSTPALPMDIRIQNNQGDTNVTTDSKWSGFFDLQTKLASVLVDEGANDPSADPSGQNRLRQVAFDPTTPTQSRGWVGWGSRPRSWDSMREYGHLEVISALSLVHLQLGCTNEES